jgi:hypothetical protein
LQLDKLNNLGGGIMAIFGKMLKTSVFILLASTSLYTSAALNSGSHLKPSSQGKVNRHLARSYLQQGAESVQQSRTVVNVGSRRAGTCTMNIGTGSSKETIVTAREIINVCR